MKYLFCITLFTILLLIHTSCVSTNGVDFSGRYVNLNRNHDKKQPRPIRGDMFLQLYKDSTFRYTSYNSLYLKGLANNDTPENAFAQGKWHDYADIIILDCDYFNSKYKKTHQAIEGLNYLEGANIYINLSFASSTCV